MTDGAKSFWSGGHADDLVKIAGLHFMRAAQERSMMRILTDVMMPENDLHNILLKHIERILWKQAYF